MTEFVKYSDKVIELSGKFADEDSMRWAIANMVMHLPSTKDKVPKNYFVRCLRKTAANQVAGQIFIDIKTKQEEAQKAAEAQRLAQLELQKSLAESQTLAEATASPQVASDETKKG